jgi:molecular chaperone DnaK (HSP70)
MQDIAGLAYNVQADEDGAACIELTGSDTGNLYPEEVSAHVVARLLAATEEETDCVVDRAVISVPAYFDEEQRDATIAAGKLHALNLPRL